MANYKEHLTTGAIVGTAVGLFSNLYKQKQKIQSGNQEKIDITQLLCYSIFGATLGAIGGILPDAIEPATNPHHRKIFHSVTMGSAVSYGLYKANKSNLPTETKMLINVSGVSYMSHLMLDSNTPKGLPIL